VVDLSSMHTSFGIPRRTSHQNDLRHETKAWLHSCTPVMEVKTAFSRSVGMQTPQDASKIDIPTAEPESMYPGGQSGGFFPEEKATQIATGKGTLPLVSL
jgi:hypothetical protein